MYINDYMGSLFVLLSSLENYSSRERKTLQPDCFDTLKQMTRFFRKTKTPSILAI